MPCSFNYPQTFPVDCIQELIAIIRAGTYRQNAQPLAHAAWTVQGYVQSLALGAPAPVVVGADAAAIRAQLTELQSALAAPAIGAEPGAAALSGNLLLELVVSCLLPLVRQLVADWLSREE